MTQPRYRQVPPKASAMIEALRGLGYSASTALADIIDNSISARARRVDLTFGWDGDNSFIAVLDDGRGMDAATLDRAMRLGDTNPLDQRHSDDLGRFGMGLKTASFSQCRRLTVASRQDGSLNCLRWDLDFLASAPDDGWYLLEDPAPGSEKRLGPLNNLSNGTLVLWEQLDRVITPGFSEQDFLNLIDSVESHLAMVFHRYLEGPRPRLRIFINGQPVSAWDPFMTEHPATFSSPVVRIGAVTVQSHVLPHKDKLTAAEEASGAGPHGWTAQQGFYVYRHERLLLAGSWLGLGRGRSWTKEEPHRLARIRIDIPNSDDAAWKIDIRKSTARPPVGIREQLVTLAEDARARARRIFAHRGVPTRIRGEPVTQAWRVDRFEGGIRYRIDQTHPAVVAVLEQAGSLAPELKAMLRIIEETVPVQRIWLDTAEGHETPRTGFSGETPAEVTRVLMTLYRAKILNKGMSPVEARRQLRQMQPFDNHPELIAALPDQLPERS